MQLEIADICNLIVIKVKLKRIISKISDNRNKNVLKSARNRKRMERFDKIDLSIVSPVNKLSLISLLLSRL